MNLKEYCKERLKVAFDLVRASSKGSLTFILVVDQRALKILSSTIKMMELINYGVTLVQRLELKRKMFKKIQVVYMVHPDSLEQVLKDFPDNDSAQYESIHILTLTKIPQYMMNSLGKNEILLKRLKTLRQVYVDYNLHNENEVCILGTDEQSFKHSIESMSGDSYQTCINGSINELSNLIVSMPTFYIVEIFYSKSAVNSFSEKIAFGVKEQLEGLFKVYQRQKVDNFTNGAPTTTLLILDRTYDAVSPLLRDYHYLPLLYDEKGVSEHKIQFKKKNEKQKIVNLNQNDQIFQKYKFKHLIEIQENLQLDFDNFRNNYAKAKNQGNMDLNQMAKVIRQMPQFSNLQDKYMLHIDSVIDLSEANKKHNYIKQCQIQQSIVTLTNSDHKKISEKDVYQMALQTISTANRNTEKAKLILMCLLSLQLKPKQKNELINMLSSLGYQGLNKQIDMIAGSNIYHLNAKKSAYPIDRYICRIEEVVKQLVNGSHGNLKYLRVGTEHKIAKSVSKNNASLGRKKIGVENEKINKPRLVVFVGSGMGYNEIRALSQFESIYHIIYASHNFMTQTEYLRHINSLGEQQL